MTARDDATQRQVEAADPQSSTWLSANAGSGKTRVLTDRVARLLLDGVNPQNILCLTYTKAAASEMQNRLFKRLGAWAMMPDDALAANLVQLGLDRDVGPDLLAEARRLFARAIETPGGLKIQTIHSFCAAVLRRFPLESGVSPQFREMEDREADVLRDQVLDTLSTGDSAPLVDDLAGYLGGGDISALTREIAGRRTLFAQSWTDADIAAQFDADPSQEPEELIQSAYGDGIGARLSPIIDMLRQGKVSDIKLADRLASHVGAEQADSSLFQLFCDVFLYGENTKSPFAARIGATPTKDLREANPDLTEDLNDLMEVTAALRDRVLAQRALARTRALIRFGQAFVSAYEERKLLRGALDFDDLIIKARQLLSEAAVAQWVLYRLDGGIDHILVDEAQDTSPDQWQVIRLLAQEFAAGDGARTDRRRTIFVVGDKKQSIYSFQGADPEEFDRMQAYFANRLAQARDTLVPLSLDHSFRSSPAILEAVDRTFTGARAEGLEKQVFHRAFHADQPGRVDLWPPVEPTKDDTDRVWHDPVDSPGAEHHTVRLARFLADDIKRLIHHETLPVRQPDGSYARRPVRPGDIMILVTRRSGLFPELISALKAANLDVAGADRLRIGGELAVRDLAALLSFLALPEDDLSLAAALRSPLFGWSEQDLFDLAHRRGAKEYLWAALRARRAEYPETLAILDDLRDQADFLRPFDLLERILVRHDGRRRLLARLGLEAEEGIDAFLAQALSYEGTAIPGLTGFLAWIETDDVTIKRQMDAASDQIRVMTVHGSKGLESPIVILPDTAKPHRSGGRADVLSDGSRLMWKSPRADQPGAMADLAGALSDAQDRERRRLLYVAMTRAESWLIVSAAGEVGSGDDSWHQIVAEGLDAAGADPLDTPTGTGQRLARGEWSGGPLLTPEAAHGEPPKIPDFDPVAPWAAAEPALTPSDLGGAKALPGDLAAQDEETALARGRMIHLLLEHLPDCAPGGRAALGRDILAGSPDAPDDRTMTELVEDALRLTSDPALAQVFVPGSLAEVPLTAELSELGGRRIHGAIDRLLVGPETITAIDFKSNRIVPDGAQDIPEGLLRQMGAYAAALAQIYPGRDIRTALLWTATGALMEVPPDRAAAALARVR